MTGDPGAVGVVPPRSRVSSGAALVLLAAAMVAAGLVAVGVAGLLPRGDAGTRGGGVTDTDVAVPIIAAAAPGLGGAVPIAPFDVPAAELPVPPSGPFEEVGSAWRVAEAGAAVAEGGRTASFALLPAPAGATTVQVTLARPRPGAGVVTAFDSPDRYLALVVDPAGRTVSVVRADGRERPRTFLRAPLAAADQPLVLALRLEGERVTAIANGLVLGERTVGEPGGSPMVGLVAGPGVSGEQARFTDLVVA